MPIFLRVTHLTPLCEQFDYKLASRLLLPDDTYTYISDAWGTTSLLDHCVATDEGLNTIGDMRVLYGDSTSDHIPLAFDVNVSLAPDVEKHGQQQPRKQGVVICSSVSVAALLNYRMLTDVKLSNIHVPAEAIMCNDVHCIDCTHINELNMLYSNIITCINATSEESLCTSSMGRNINVRPVWNVHIKELYGISREAFIAWRESGSQPHGHLFIKKNEAKARVKYAIRYVNKNVDCIRRDSLANNLLKSDTTDFWKELRRISRRKVYLPLTVDGVSGVENITDMWRNYYVELFNCLPIRHDHAIPDLNVQFTEDMLISCDEISVAIANLKNNKTCGLDGVQAEHLIHCSERIKQMLCMCFNSFLSHGFLPNEFMYTVLVPIVKDKRAKISDKTNYRPIALANITSKVFERILLDRLNIYLKTCANQFGFKKKHGADMCIYALKELVTKYTSQGSNIFCCFLDASKAFDWICHNTLFNKLIVRGVPHYLIRIIVYWYTEQTLCVRWSSCTSRPFRVSNGVRQGGLLSPLLFSLYMDDLSINLNALTTGCIAGGRMINHLMYADDIVVFSPSAVGLEDLLRVCELFGIEHDIIFNYKKCAVMVFKSHSFRHVCFGHFYLKGQKIENVEKIQISRSYNLS